MTAWYFLRKPVYLWQFVNIDGAGDVLVYPVRTSPFNSNPFFAFTHDVMRLMHWPIVGLGGIGSILVWLPGISALLPESRGLVLRTASLLLIFLTVATFLLNNPVRFAVPVLPALFLTAMVPPLVLVRWIGRTAVTDVPKIPSALLKAGMEAASFDIQSIILKLLIQKALISKDDACQALRQMHDSHKENESAASAIRLVMVELGCSNVPDH
jgi:hypothetical protein